MALPLWIRGLLGGRPMTMKAQAYFHDCITGEPVHIFVDTLGRYWCAQGRWAWFRVRTHMSEDDVAFGVRCGLCEQPTAGKGRGKNPKEPKRG